MTGSATLTWRQLISTAVLVFLIALAGCGIAFALWLRDISGPQMVILGSGDRLSILVSDGPARLVLATGDDRIAFGNAIARYQPIFARRIDVLLLAGQDETLLVPWSATQSGNARATFAIAPLLPSPETEAIGPTPTLGGPRRIRLGPNVMVTVETAVPYGTDPLEQFPVWRATIEHGQSRVVVLSGGSAAEDFPPLPPASVLVVSGDDPAQGWELAPAVALIANDETTRGSDLRDELDRARRAPRWTYRVSAGEAFRIRFVDGGIELPAEVGR